MNNPQSDLQSTGQPELLQWVLDRIHYYLKGDVLEFGSQDGLYSDLLLQSDSSLTLSDAQDINCQVLEQRFKHSSQVRSVHRFSPFKELSSNNHLGFSSHFDAVFSLRLADQSPIDKVMTVNALNYLKPGGHFVFWVRSFIALYEELDSAFNYWHKSNKSEVQNILGPSFHILKMRYLRISEVPMEHLLPTPPANLFTELVPLFQFKPIANYPEGVSVIVIAQKL